MFTFRNSEAKIQKVQLQITNRTILRILLLTAAVVVVFVAVRRALPVLTLVFSSLLIALALNAPVQALARKLPGKRRGNRTLATSISYIVIALLIGGFIASVMPPITKQTVNFVNAVPELIQQSNDQNSAVGSFIRKYRLEKQVDKFSDELSGKLQSATGTALSTVGKIGSSILSVLTILVLSFMMLIEGPRWMKLFDDMIADEHRARTERIVGDMYRVIKGYINGQVVLAGIAALLILPMMIVLDIAYPFALLFIVFICGLIPMVGHTIGAAIVTTVALFTSPWAALIILSYYILYQQIENYFVQPKVQANSTNMSPLLVFVSVLVGSRFGGIFGGLVAIPVAGCIRIVLLDYLHRNDIISDPEANPVTDTTLPTD